MSITGLLALLVAFAACVVSVGCFALGHIFCARKKEETSESFVWMGRLAVVGAMAALTVCCAILLWCFLTEDNLIDYVVRNQSNSTGEFALLYKISGLWAGRAGSLLFWAWLISVFNSIVVFATRKYESTLDSAALTVSQLVLLAFVGVLLLSPDNMPFKMLDSRYYTDSGALNAMASTLGMNSLLEHWAMAIHPPTLFIGYAGFTIPFAYAVAALIVNDDSDTWVRRSTPYVMFSWLMLGFGIGLGAVWAYVVLGWGGYWGWDPVENASLLPWLVGVALIHSFTIYRKRGQFKRWSIMCACLAFSFVVLGTFITRSGLVESVHAFEGDEVSLILFLTLIVASLMAGAIGLILRKKTFGTPKPTDAEEIDSLISRDAAYYINNLIMIVFAVLLTYMTVSSALPAPLPFAGQSISAGTYNAIARPLGILYCALIAVCPLLGWRKTEGSAFFKRARVPGIYALVLFAAIMAYFLSTLLPSYNAIVDAGGTAAEGLLEQGAPIYYNGLAIVGLLVASLLFFNAAFMVAHYRRIGTNKVRTRFAAIGGGLCHAAVGIILIGLIGSSMYVTVKNEYLPYDEEADTCTQPFTIQDFELTYAGNNIEVAENQEDVTYTVFFDVTRGGTPVGTVAPAVQVVGATQQQKLIASVLPFPGEDLFVVYKGLNEDDALSMDVRVNPLINLVWIGFALMMAGSIVAALTKRTDTEVATKAASATTSTASATKAASATTFTASATKATATAAASDNNNAEVSSGAK